jgi:Fe-S cluster biogenesis protein NfuA
MEHTVIESALLERIEKALDTLRPHLQSDGGDVQLVGLSPEMVVQVRWLGACQACSMNVMTLKAGIEYTLKSAVPEIKGVEAVD